MIESLRGLRVLREDPEWLSKLGVASVLLLSGCVVPLLGQVAVLGWVALILRRFAAGQERPLPRLNFELDYLGKLVATGFKPFMVLFLWTLPCSMLLGTIMACTWVGLMMVAARTGARMVAAGAAGPLAGLQTLVSCALPALLMIAALLLLLAQIPAQMALLRAELTDDLSEAFRFREVIQMTRLVFRELLLSSLVLAVVHLGLSLFSMLLCGLPLIPLTAAMMVAGAHVRAQLYKLYLERGGEPLAMAPLDVVPAGMSGTF